MSIKSKIAELFKKAAPPQSRAVAVDGWGWRRMFDTFPGSWQQDVEVKRDAVLAQSTVFSCITLIASDIAKLRLRVCQNYGGVWLEKTTEVSDLLRKPNHYQTRQLFVEQWAISKLSTGNAYLLKERDRAGQVVKMYVLDPARVTPLVAPDGSVYYQLQEDDLAQVGEQVAVPASEIIHDRFNCLFHPLVGLSPIFASGLAATQALQIQQQSAKFFKNQSRPSGILTAPTKISDEAARRIKEYWEKNYQGANKIGSVAVLGDNLSYTPLTITAVDAQLVEQLKISAEQVCSTFHVPGFMVGVAPPPAQGGVDGETQRYYNQCLQALIEAKEASLDEGLGFDGVELGTDFDLDGLLRMDSKTLSEVESLKVQRGISSPNEARQKFGLLPAVGGDSPMAQQQNFSLEALAKRDAGEDPFASGGGGAASKATIADLVRETFLQERDTLVQLAASQVPVIVPRDAVIDCFNAELDAAGSLTFSLRSDGRLMTKTIALDLPRYHGVFKAGTVYRRGSLTTYAGSVWHCQETTTEPPRGPNGLWTLAVKGTA